MGEREHPLLSDLRKFVRDVLYNYTADFEGLIYYIPREIERYANMLVRTSAHYADVVVGGGVIQTAQELTRCGVVPSLQAQAAVTVARTCYRHKHEHTPECGCWRNQRMADVLRRWISAAEAADYVITSTTQYPNRGPCLLHLACVAYNDRAMHTLLRMGADPYAPDVRSNMTPVHLVILRVISDGLTGRASTVVAQSMHAVSSRSMCYVGYDNVCVVYPPPRLPLYACIAELLHVCVDAPTDHAYSNQGEIAIAIQSNGTTIAQLLIPGFIPVTPRDIRYYFSSGDGATTIPMGRAIIDMCQRASRIM